MLLSTPVAPGRVPFQIDHANHLLVMGSCFADGVGERLCQWGFDAMCNPFGTLYNPLSIAEALRRIGQCQYLCEADVVERDGLWHSWYHHTRFSRGSMQQCLDSCNQALEQAHAFYQHADTVVLTLGTAFVYYLAQGHRLVANCHKVPASCFERVRLDVGQCVEALRSMPLGGRRVVLTVSPIRHLADGAHGNQLSKSTLLLAVDQWLEQAGGTACYFPAYEIVLDELRDYRFFDRDMAHPSALAVDIVAQRFADTFFSPQTQQRCDSAWRQWRREQHRTISTE